MCGGVKLDTRIYVMTHKEMDKISNDIYIPLHVGKKGKEDLGYAGDDSGDNISEKNPFYCELTGMYWLWKNVNCDIIGVCHYRRFFCRDEKLLDKDSIELRLQKYPIIVPDTQSVLAESVYKQYEMQHYAKDLDLCREVIKEKYPEYLPAFDYSMQTVLVSIGNMWITYKSIYDRYCSWLFDILFEVEKRIDMTGYDDYQKRVMGFLSERLFRAWLYMQPEMIAEESFKMIEPKDFYAVEKGVELTYRYIKLKMEQLLRIYKSDIKETLAQPLLCKDQFEGKIPVWVCWWQGEEDMPELVRCCVDSLKRNLPQEKTVFRLITLENCLEYVTFTETIIEKFNAGKISYTHLSDVLRAELLYRYGGMWIDATYYVTQPIDKNIFDKTLYTLKFDSIQWSADITRGRWSANLWCTQKNNRLFQFLMEGLWCYWEMEDKPVNDCIMDYIIAVAVEELPEIQKQMEECVVSQNTVFELHECMNQKYSKERWDNILSRSVFYKLNRRFEYRKENLAGEQTMYGHLLKQ